MLINNYNPGASTGLVIFIFGKINKRADGQTDGRTDGHYQVHNFPPLRCFAFGSVNDNPDQRSV